MLKNRIRKALAEAMGTFVVVFSGCGAMMIATRVPQSVSSSVIPVVFGLSVTVMVYAVGHISGAHFNPAVTLAFAVVRHFPKNQILEYWIAQFLGAFLALALLFLLLPPGVNFGATVPFVSPLRAVAYESVLTFFLMFVIIAVATDTRAVGTMAGAAIGATVMLAAYVGGPITGASMNPARSLAPAIFEHRCDVLWIYFIAAPLGAVAAALFYEWIRCEDGDGKSKKKAEGCC